MRRIAVLLVMVAVAGVAWAQPAPSGGRSWNSLTPAERTALAPLQRDWNSIDVGGKQRWLEVAARLPSMPA